MTGQTNFLQSLGWAVLNSFWQLALLWVIYQIIILSNRRATASFKSSLAFSLLAGGFAWFVYTFISVYLAGSQAVVVAAFTEAAGNDMMHRFLVTALPFASVLYLLLLIFPLLRFIRNYRYVQVIRKYGLSRIAPEWKLFVNRIAAQMSIRHKVQVWVSEFVSSPVTIGFLKPIILVPLAALNHLTPQQLEAVLLHELSHIRRFDYLVNFIINFIRTVLYFNPFVRAFVKIIEKERERSCDEMVLQFQYNSYEYASALLILEKENQANTTFLIGATGKSHDLLGRVELIMGVGKKNTFSLNRLAGLLAGLFCVISLNAVLLLAKPGYNGRSMAASVSAKSHHDYFPKSPLVPVKPLPLRSLNNNQELSSTVSHQRKPKDGSGYDIAALSPQFAEYAAAAVNPALINASLEMANVPELKRYQEEQVKIAVEASKKVLENVQWKNVERSIADAFTPEEKEQLKENYEKQMAKFDWVKWERELKVAYDKIDWDKTNAQLSMAVSQVRLDSIQTVYNKVISKLDGARRELSLNELKGIPDTDITLQEIERKRSEIQRALNQLKAIRSKKVVHL